ncbi:MAG: glycosyltransferase family A protein [Acidobacteriota bacterium]
MPEFSIVIPAYNRERLLARAIQSCLAQHGADFEIVVVDDGSTRPIACLIESLGNPRIKLIRHEDNRGHAAARNSGVSAAQGEWVVMLDSDDELLPGALAYMSSLIAELGSATDRFAFMYRRDDGGVSPSPPMRCEHTGYAAALRALEDRTYFDFLQCIRRSVFDTLRWHEWKCAGAVLFQMDFPRLFRTYTSSEILGLVHTDAPDRVSWQRRARAYALRAGLDCGEEMDQILARHGEALAQHAPRTLERFLRVRASYFFLVGARVAGIRQSLRCLRASPLSLETWLQLVAGLAGPDIFARFRSMRAPPT